MLGFIKAVLSDVGMVAIDFEYEAYEADDINSPGRPESVTVLSVVDGAGLDRLPCLTQEQVDECEQAVYNELMEWDVHDYEPDSDTPYTLEDDSYMDYAYDPYGDERY